MAVAEVKQRKRRPPVKKTKPQSMGMVRVKSKAQVTLPAKAREQLGISEGDYLEVTIRDDELVLRRKFMLDGLPEVELSPEWQRMLDEALEAEQRGEIRSFPDVKTGLEALRRAVGLD